MKRSSDDRRKKGRASAQNKRPERKPPRKRDCELRLKCGFGLSRKPSAELRKN